MMVSLACVYIAFSKNEMKVESKHERGFSDRTVPTAECAGVSKQGKEGLVFQEQ
jgi:hypothetical protein